ncbi:MAG: hemolysin family protein [Candidatus Marinimicrobia bacterium]|nr:hemolysin family protein [Candidatus Neomarinimicrobiota bacterium]MCF7830089.1 hemolysin family protein [Candidatus Neomarinimicrobiota bacterium]MCF7882136.1 hemolysin family protein [Candidatus Neomarinimicrobiota bacterium]
MMLEIVLAVIGLILSAFFSGAEIAYVSANPMQVEVWKRQDLPGAREASKLLNEPSSFLNITLIGTNIANIMATSFATIVLIEYFNEITVIALTALVILTFGEILPKTIFRERANVLTLKITPLLRGLRYPLYPFLVIAGWYSRLLTKWTSAEEKISDAFSKDDLRLLFTRVGSEDVIDKHEKRFITKLFSFGNQTARDAMTPRTDISAIDKNRTIQEAKEVFLESGHSKLPVYEDTIDKIVGVIFLYDMFEEHETIQEVIKDATFVPESKNIGEMLREFQENKNSIGIVIDEYGGTAGLITVEDIVEELFGEFEDEFDFDEMTVKKIDNGFVISGRAEIDYLNETLHLDLPDGEYETISGYLEDRLGRIPSSGEEIALGAQKFIITKATQKKIEQVKLILDNNSGSSMGSFNTGFPS